jgi:hypothetical protein
MPMKLKLYQTSEGKHVEVYKTKPQCRDLQGPCASARFMLEATNGFRLDFTWNLNKDKTRDCFILSAV